MLLIARCWLACAADPEPVEAEAPPTLAELAERSGYAVGRGVVRAFDYDVCCLPDASCLHNNPSTPYQFAHLPPAPGQVEPEFEVDDDGRAWFFHLRPDEAVVQIGRTAPTRYYSWRSYLVSRDVDGDRVPMLGSLGPSLNNLVVGERLGVEDPRSEPFAVVTTLDAAVEREVVSWLVASGTDPSRIFVDRIAPELVRATVQPEGDTFLLMIRAAMFDSVEVREAWVADAGIEVLRISPVGPEAPPREPHPLQPLPPQGADTDESMWAEQVEALGEAIRAAYPDRPVVESESQAAVFETYECLPDCAFESRDRYYAAVPPVTLPPDQFLVAYGVNHARTGKATYANVAVNAEANHLGLDVVESDEMVGSARAYLPDGDGVDDLYAVVVARSCEPFGGQPCIEVAEGCPGVALDDKAKVDFRAYLEPATGSGPLATELIADRALLFGPAAP
jgi:hypothetical protein